MQQTQPSFISELQGQHAQPGGVQGCVCSTFSRAESRVGAGDVRVSREQQCPWVQFCSLYNFSFFSLI